MCKSEHKVTHHMKEEGTMAQAKEQNESLETDSNEMEVYELPDKKLK